MSHDNDPAVTWAYAVVATLVACAGHWFVRVVLPGGGAQFLPFMIVGALAAVAWGRNQASFVLAVGLVTVIVRLLDRSTGFNAAPLGIGVGVAGYVVLAALIVYIGHVARIHASDSQRARAELERSLAAAEVGSWHFDFATQRMSFSPNVGPMVGRPEGFVHATLDAWQADVHPDDLAAVMQKLRAARNGESYEVHYRLRTPAGEWRWLLVRGRLLRNSAGRLQRADGIVMNITAVRAVEIDRWRSREELRTMLDLIPAGVAIAHDRECKNITVSPRFARLLGISTLQNASSTGHSRDELPYRSMRNGVEIPGDELPMQVAARTACEVHDFEVDIVYGDGRLMHLLIGAAPLFDADGTVRGAIGVHTDITALKQAQRELERAGRQKDIFLATLAHELRNPLAPIRYAGALLRSAQDAGAAAQAGRIIERQSAQMAQLLDELLDMSRITRDVIELRRGAVDFADVVRLEVEALAPRLAEAPRRLVFHGGTAAWVNGDETRLHQVVSNLLSNAVKYTHEGGLIEVRLESGADEVHLTVRDDGIGIAPEDLTNVFDLFARIHKPGQATAGGLGIGLAVVRRLVELHGGRIAVTSAGPGRGAQFTVHLPRGAAPAVRSAGIAPSNSAVRSIGEAGRRVLVVDDNVDTAESLSVLLASRGFAVRTTHDGRSALQVAESFRPEIAVLDLGLPDMPGHQVADLIRAQPWGEDTLLIAVTGWGQVQDRARTTASGFAHHLVKPVEPTQLLDLLQGPAAHEDAGELARA